eukprot:6106522-Amphidinium_carterae.1
MGCNRCLASKSHVPKRDHWIPTSHLIPAHSTANTTMCHEKPAPMLGQWAPVDDCSGRLATCVGPFPAPCSAPVVQFALAPGS